MSETLDYHVTLTDILILEHVMLQMLISEKKYCMFSWKLSLRYPLIVFFMQLTGLITSLAT